MPETSRGAAAVALGGKIYVFGGLEPSDANADPLNPPTGAYRHARVYDPAANSWAALSPMPVGAYVLRAHAIGDKIYVLPAYGVGGFKNDLLEYDPHTDTWSSKSPSPTYRYEFASAVVNGRIYVIAGQGTIDDGPWVSGKAWSYKDRVSIYDPATDTWSVGEHAPNAVAGASSCAAGGKIYVFGGSNASGKLASTLVYDTAANSWASGPPLLVAKEGSECVKLNDQFYILGGRNASGSTDAVDRYDPVTNTWSQFTRLPTGRYWLGAAPLADEIFTFGGEVTSGQPTNVVEILNPLL
jgi:N-acetylneuraminic acid mutarotase